MIIKILTVMLITALGMWGGQKNKWVRRYILPLIALSYTTAKEEKKKWKAALFVPLIGVLSMGYGESSTIRTLWRKIVDEPWADRLTRITIGLLMSIPFWFFGKWYASIALPIAYSVRAGGFKITKTKDFLYEDLCRYGVLGILIVI